MDTMRIRQSNLTELIGRYDTAQQFATAAGMNPTHVSQMKIGNKRMGEDVARKLERALQLGHGWMDADHSAGASEPVEIVQGRDDVAIGHYSDSGLMPGRFAVRKRWLRERGYSPKGLATIEVGTLSFAPRIQPGDLVLVDITAGLPMREGHVYAIEAGAGYRLVRAMFRSDGSLSLHNDNIAFPAEHVAAEAVGAVKVFGVLVAVIDQALLTQPSIM